MATYTVIGHVDIYVNVVDIEKLQNIDGNNWGDQVICGLNYNRTTYCFLDKASRKLVRSAKNEYDAYLQENEVRLRGNRISHLVYHRNEDFNRINGTINCLLVIKELNGEKYLLICYFPKFYLPNPNKKSTKDDQEKEVEELLSSALEQKMKVTN